MVAQISEELGVFRTGLVPETLQSITVILMAGIIGHEEPLLSLVDWSKIKIEVEAVSEPFQDRDVPCN